MADSGSRGIVFDKDGTLFDLQATWAGVAGRFLRDLAGADDLLFETLAEVAGYDTGTGRLRPGSVMVADTPADLADTLLPFLPEAPARSALIDRMNRTAASARMEPAAPLAPLLDRLRAAGFILGVATNDAEGPARTHLTTTGIIDRFETILGYDSGHGAKPAPGQLLAFARIEGVDPARVTMVGDSLHDLMAGRAAGMCTVGVLTGLATEEELAPLADVVLPDIGHLPGWLGLPAG